MAGSVPEGVALAVAVAGTLWIVIAVAGAVLVAVTVLVAVGVPVGARYQAISREPITSTYRGLTIVGFPPPSSGGIHVAEILGMLEHFDLANIQREDPGKAAHLVLESMKLAFADRAFW